jgi:UDP-N-acetylmuramoyl-L-alanyl-D-glutamate--2,6-diaminopimelate ligase
MDTSISLSELLREFPFPYHQQGRDASITGVASDSRQVQPGQLFVAAEGEFADGHRFIPDAIQRGAAAVVGSQDLPGLPVPYVRVPDGRRALPYLAAAFYGYPARKLTMLGVTGTDGKTTTVNLIYQILQAAGLKVGMVSTVNAVIGEQVLDTGFHVTTPDAPDVQRWRRWSRLRPDRRAGDHLRTAGRSRVDACEFDVGVVSTSPTSTSIIMAYEAYQGRLRAHVHWPG